MELINFEHNPPSYSSPFCDAYRFRVELYYTIANSSLRVLAALWDLTLHYFVLVKVLLDSLGDNTLHALYRDDLERKRKNRNNRKIQSIV